MITLSYPLLPGTIGWIALSLFSLIIIIFGEHPTGVVRVLGIFLGLIGLAFLMWAMKESFRPSKFLMPEWRRRELAHGDKR